MNYYEEIKEELVNNELYKKAKDYSKNKSDLNTYYNVGKLLTEARKVFGKSIIKDYSQKIILEINKKYSIRLLYKMIKYYEFITFNKVPTLSAQISWSHLDELLKFNDINKISYYINVISKQNLSIRQLRERIKSKEYERLDEETKLKLINKEELEIKDLVKNPIVIKNKYDTTKISEKMLHKLILEDIESFMSELGEGFCFIKSEYKIKVGNSYNYLDLLLFNYIYNAFVVVELKVTELKKEYIGQIEVYMNYIDKHIKSINQDKTIGIIICRENDGFVIKYASDKRILVKEFVLS